jgi:hypothetical protein
MPIPENILSKMKCCLNDDGHIVHEPVLFKCSYNACRKCISDSNLANIKCFGCNGNHEIVDLVNVEDNKFIDSLIHSFLNDLFEDLKNKMKSTAQFLKSK